MIELRLVGYGSHGRSIAQASKELADSIQIVVVLDIDTSKHSEIVKGSAKPYSDLEDFLRHPGLAGVIVASPAETHKPIVERVVEVSLPIELEKPIATSFHEARETVQITQDAQVPLMIGMTTG